MKNPFFLVFRTYNVLVLTPGKSDPAEDGERALNAEGRTQAARAFAWRKKLGLQPRFTMLDGTSPAEATAFFPDGTPKNRSGRRFAAIPQLQPSAEIKAMLDARPDARTLREAGRDRPLLSQSLWPWSGAAMNEIIFSFDRARPTPGATILLAVRPIIASVLANAFVDSSREYRAIRDSACANGAAFWIKKGFFKGMIDPKKGLIPYVERPSLITPARARSTPDPGESLSRNAAE